MLAELERICEDLDGLALEGLSLNRLLNFLAVQLTVAGEYPMVLLTTGQTGRTQLVEAVAGRLGQGLSVRELPWPEALPFGGTFPGSWQQVFGSELPGRVTMVPLGLPESAAGLLCVVTEEVPETSRLEAGLALVARRVGLLIKMKRDQQQLQLQGTALAHAANAVFITDTDGIIRWVNESFTRMSGYSARESVGNRPSIMKSGEHGEEFFRELWLTISRGDPWEGEVVELHRDGFQYIVHQTVTPIRDESGAISHYVAIHEDITERKRLEEELKQARDAAVRSARLRQEFLGRIGHEIRTPMNGVLGMLDLLADTQLESSQREYVETAARSANRLLDSMNAIIDYSRLEAGQVVLQDAPLRLDEVLNQVIETLHAQAARKALSLVTEIAQGLPLDRRGDSIRLGQILLNLTSNAIRFTERGEVRIRAAAAENSELIRFEVIDTGKGIASDDLEAIFEPYHQSGEGTEGGSGLGLAICRQLVEAMGGRMGVQSQPGTGSTFWLEIPLASDPTPRRESAQSTTLVPASDGASVVLVVDDNPVNRQVAVGMLERLGHQAETADSGRAALERFQTGNYRLVLLDCQMPDMDGHEVARRIRALETGTRTPIIAMTAYGPDQMQACRNSGMDHAVFKPLRLEVLRAALGDAHMPAAEPMATPDGNEMSRNALIDERNLEQLFGLLGEHAAKAIELYIADARNHRWAFTAALEANDSEALRRAAHALKGSSANVGAVECARLCASLEQCAEDSVASCGEAVSEALRCLDATVEELERWCSDFRIRNEAGGQG